MRGHVFHADLSQPTPSRARGTKLAVCLLGLFATASLLAGWLSDGVYHEDDLTHYLMARWAHHDWRHLVDPWGRPGFTIPYSAVAWIGSSPDGLQACRVLSTAIAAATAWLCFCIARRLGFRHAWAAIPLLALQPLYSHLSFATLTETPLAFYFALATWLLLTGRLAASAAIVALTPLTRDEAAIVLAIWAVAMFKLHARWWMYPLLIWAVAAHNIVCGEWLGFWPALRWLQPTGADHYGQGTPLTFVPKLALACGPVVVALAVLGARRVMRRPTGWVIVAVPAAWFAVETLVYMRGAYSSGGYARFLVPICPWLAILAAGGVQPLLVRCSRAINSADSATPETRNPRFRLRPAGFAGQVRFGLVERPLASILPGGPPPSEVGSPTITATVSSAPPRLKTRGTQLMPLRSHLVERALASILAVAAGVWILSEIEWHWRTPIITPAWQWWVTFGRIVCGLACVPFAVCAWRLKQVAGRPESLAVRRMGYACTLLVMATGLVGFIPLRITAGQARIRELAPTITQLAGDDVRILTLNRWVYHWTGIGSPWAATHDIRAHLDQAKPGTLFAWDARFCTEPVPNLSYAEIRNRPGWVVRWPIDRVKSADPPFLAVFQRQAVMQASNQPTVVDEEP